MLDKKGIRQKGPSPSAGKGIGLQEHRASPVSEAADRSLSSDNQSITARRLAELASPRGTLKDSPARHSHLLRSSIMEGGKVTPHCQESRLFLPEYAQSQIQLRPQTEKHLELQQHVSPKDSEDSSPVNKEPGGVSATTASTHFDVRDDKLDIDNINRQSKDPPGIPPTPPAQEVIKLSDVMQRLDSLAGLSTKMDAMAEDLKALRVIQETTAKLSQDVVEVQDKLSTVEASVRALECHGEELEQNQQIIAKELLDLKHKVQQQDSQHAQELLDLKYKVQQQDIQQAAPPSSDFEFLKIEAAFRRNNLIFEGIREPQSEREGSPRQQVSSFIRNVLRLSHIQIDRAYRLGKPRARSSPPRPILVRFTVLGDCEDVWRARTRLLNRSYSHYTIKEDLPMELRPVMSALLKVQQAARKFPNKYYVYIRDFKVYVNGIPYEADKLEALPKDLRPSHTSTPGNSKVVVFFGKDSRFSNHYTSLFLADDFSFLSIEQYLAYNRARIANDQELMDRAIGASDPLESKRILNLLHDAPGQEVWEKERRDILFTGLLAKFQQSADLRNYLLSSENRTLGEASRNKVWGIGLTLNDGARLDPNQWTGENLLGKTLMDVRHFIVFGEEPSSFTNSQLQGHKDPNPPPPDTTRPPDAMGSLLPSELHLEGTNSFRHEESSSARRPSSNQQPEGAGSLQHKLPETRETPTAQNSPVSKDALPPDLQTTNSKSNNKREQQTE